MLFRSGYSLLTQGTFGAVIQHIEPAFVGSLPIPNFPKSFQVEVDNLIQKSARLREEAADKLNEAKQLLSNYINVSFAKSTYKTSVVNSKTIWNSLKKRIDPPALMNDGVILMEKIQQAHSTQFVGNVSEVYRPGIFKRCYVSSGLPYIKGSEIFNVNPFKR